VYIISCFNKNPKILWQKKSAATVTKKVTDALQVIVLEDQDVGME